MTTPSIAVLCVTHGRPDMLRKCLASCVRQDHPRTEVIVVLNPADPVAEQAVREAAPVARLLRTHKNLGFFPALNLALANTEADYVMIIDDDAWFLDGDALPRLVEEFRRDPRLGAITCNLEGPTEAPITGGDQFIRAFTTGFTMFPRKAVTEWVGYFPDVFFRSAGETYLCTQLWEQLRPVKRIENVRMHHALAQKGRSSRDWHFYGLRSQILCAVMREPASWLPPVLASKFLKSLLQSLKSGTFTIWLHAWASSVLHLPDALALRRPISSKARRLLARLEASPIHNLDALPEWRAMAGPEKSGQDHAKEKLPCVAS
jgi:GT2 family glycosyltransferase